MTSNIRSIIVFFCSLIFFYLCTAFVVWEFNPANWTEATRVTLVWLGVGISSASAIASKGLE